LINCYIGWQGEKRSRKGPGHQIRQRRKRREGCKEPDDYRVVRVQDQSQSQSQSKSNALSKSKKESEHEGTLNFCRKCLKVIDKFRSFWFGKITIRKEGLKMQAIDTKSAYKLSRKRGTLYEKI